MIKDPATRAAAHGFPPLNNPPAKRLTYKAAAHIVANQSWFTDQTVADARQAVARAKERVEYWVHITWSAIIVVVGTLLGVGLASVCGLVGYFIIGPPVVSLGHMIGLLP